MPRGLQDPLDQLRRASCFICARGSEAASRRGAKSLAAPAAYGVSAPSPRARGISAGRLRAPGAVEERRVSPTLRIVIGNGVIRKMPLEYFAEVC